MTNNRFLLEPIKKIRSKLTSTRSITCGDAIIVANPKQLRFPDTPSRRNDYDEPTRKAILIVESYTIKRRFLVFEGKKTAAGNEGSIASISPDEMSDVSRASSRHTRERNPFFPADRGSRGEKREVRAEVHPFVLIANHQLSEKRPAPEILRSILTSRRVARVRNFTFGPTTSTGRCVQDISLASCPRLFVPLAPSSAYLAPSRSCVCARGRTN